jgi:hypothetical protein
MVKVAHENMLQIFEILAWGYGSIPWNAFSHLEKDKDLRDAITSFRTAYANKMKMAWDPILWEQKFNKTICAQEM